MHELCDVDETKSFLPALYGLGEKKRAHRGGPILKKPGGGLSGPAGNDPYIDTMPGINTFIRRYIESGELRLWDPLRNESKRLLLLCIQRGIRLEGE